MEEAQQIFPVWKVPRPQAQDAGSGHTRRPRQRTAPGAPPRAVYTNFRSQISQQQLGGVLPSLCC